MDRRAPSPQTSHSGNPATPPRPGPQPRPPTAQTPETLLKTGRALLHTQRHFFPELPRWLDQFPDSREPLRTIYDKRFLITYSLMGFILQLGSRRQLNFDLRGQADESHVLANLNRLAHTQQESLPVDGTVDHYLEHTDIDAFPRLRTQMINRLIRMKYLDAGRLQGKLVAAGDATTYLVYDHQHCPHCLVQHRGDQCTGMHQSLELKVLGPEGITLSMASAFIENGDAPANASAERVKQDCEQKAFARVAEQVRVDFPQVKLCLTLDALYMSGAVFALCEKHKLSYVIVFKPGSAPALWAEVQALLALCPANVLERTTKAGAHQVFRWVTSVDYTDSEGRSWRFNALFCRETVKGVTTEWAWVTDLKLDATTVVEVAEKGGRSRWQIENQGFNRQKNSGMELEHAYSQDPEKQKAYYYLLQIAHIVLVLLEHGRALRQLVAAAGRACRTVVEFFGSLKNIAKRLLESLRGVEWEPEEAKGADTS